jgi:hypothetical protein
LPDSSPKSFFSQGAPRAELARLCRNICLAREQGTIRPTAAESEFLSALNTVKETFGTISVNETDLREVVASEASRVADAVVLVELIASRLTARELQIPALAVRPIDQPEHSAPPLSPPIPFPVSPADQPLNIADLLDGMLSQEKRDTRRPAQR